jgi:hypothetical protein
MKAGTTTLYNYLRQHPDVFMSSVKEPQFFSRRAVSAWNGPDPSHLPLRRLEEYQLLFADAATKIVRGEATPIYLCDPGAVDEISGHVPDVKLIAILRQPADRAYSAYLMKCHQGWERLGFEEALAAEPERTAANWRFSWWYAALSRYAEQLERYYRRFRPEQIKVVLFDDLLEDPRRLMRGLFRFLGVDESFEVDTSGPYNAAFAVRYPVLQRWVYGPRTVGEYAGKLVPLAARPVWRKASRALRAWNSAAAPLLAPVLRARLTHEWDDEIRRLEKLIDRDLSRWRRVEGNA